MEKELRQENINLVKIVLFGPESTGKTTLSIQLAKHYNTVWVQEYARPYLQKVWNQERRTCQQKDILPIAFGQIALENRLSKRADKVLICDTDLLETKVYSSAYYGGFVDPILEKAATENTYDLYLLTYIDTPWEADDLRDRPEQRLEMFEAFQKALDQHHRPYLLLKGDKESRLKKAVEAIDAILYNEKDLYSYSDSLKNE
jgi:NadR type nicotinamide-nucleotide adenylyltransferase|tara:strand:+ start:5237 stop:5842 length:606 start_codon:yes stop_codon:yes gene_type:complete